MKETYQVKTPNRIVFGDPMYFKEFKGEKLQRLVVDIQPEERFTTKVVLEEAPYDKPSDKYPDIMRRTMTIYAAPEDMLGVYMKGMMYASQQEDVKSIGVDTAAYYLQIGNQSNTFHTGEDGYWGLHSEYSHMNGKQKISDGTAIMIELPENETFESMREHLQNLFENVEQLENVEPDEESGMSEDNVPGINM